MVSKLIFVVSMIVVTLTSVISDQSKTLDKPDTQPIPYLLWVASDPIEDATVSKVSNVSKFVNFIESHRIELIEIYNKNDVITGTALFSTNADDSGTRGVNWPSVFAKFVLKKTIGLSEDKEHGVPTLVSWSFRKTGPGTSYPSVNRDGLIMFILEHKTNIITYLNAGDVKGLINYLDETAIQSETRDVNWKTVINDLKDNRQLFKYPCGFLNLQLCDRKTKD